MSKPLTLAEIAANAATLEVTEAIALVLGVADESIQDDGTWRALPPSENILLSASGRVSLVEAGEDIPESGHVKMLAELLKSLLGVDQAEHRPHAPGGLLVLIARACGTMDLAVPSHAAFREALLRFGSADERVLSSLYWRNISHRPSTHPAQPGTVVPLRPARMPDADRRARTPHGYDLRNDAREAELELFRTLVPAEPSRSALSGRTRAAAAATLAIAALAASFMFGLNVARDHRSPDAPTNTRTASQTPAGAAASTPRGALEDSQEPATEESPLLSASAIGADVFSPSFIEHGHALLFHAGRARSSLMRLSLDDPQHATVATVLQDGATNYHAVRSPDGRWLAYDSDRDGTRAVYVAQVDGHGVKVKKVSGDGYAAVPRWSPDGRKLAFVRGEPRRPRVWNVWVADLASDSLARISHHAVGQAWGASWFPGGTRLAYSVEDRLIVADLARGTRRVIRSPRPGHLVRTPAVSPDGRWIVFQVHRDGAWLLEVATGRMRRVLADATAEEFAWSPDSRRVVYHTHRGGGWSLWQLAFGRTT